MNFEEAQSNEYLNLIKYRLNNVYLTWVEQILDIINEKLSKIFNV